MAAESQTSYSMFVGRVTNITSVIGRLYRTEKSSHCALNWQEVILEPVHSIRPA